MLYIRCEGSGSPDVLVTDKAAIPTPGPGEVLIKVAAAGVNRPDVFQRMGNYPPPPGATDVLGLEVSGTIVGLGGDSGNWSIGDQVCALVASGGYAEFCVAPAPLCLPVPRGLSLIEAAGLPETFLTVWDNVFDRGSLRSGETFLVHGGSSGIGTTAIQLARAFGARVFTTAGNEEKCRFCTNLGADRAINYREEDFVQVVKTLTEGRGVDLVLDMVGGSYIQRNIEALALEGRLVQIAFLQGSNANVDFRSMMAKRLIITGSTLRPRSVEQKAEIAQSLKEKAWPLLETGEVKSIIFRTFPLAQASAAHRLMESSEHIGKIILTMEA